MKRKLVTILLTLLLTLSAFDLVACNKNDTLNQNEHVHNYVEKVVAPTCMDEGYTEYTCDCGHTYNDDYVDCLGHSFTNYTYNNDATPYKSGTKTATCDREGCDRVSTIIGISLTQMYGGLVFADVEGGTAYSIIDYKGSATELIIPLYCNEKPIISIGDKAFHSCKTLKTITFAENSKIKSIADNAFAYCYSLESIEIPDSVTSLGAYAFYECSSLESIEIPDSVTSLGAYAFYNCSSLESIEIPASVKSLGASSFEKCQNLKNLIISDNVMSIGEKAFDNCKNLQYNEFDNALYLGNNENKYAVLVKEKDKNITSCQINLNTKYVCASAFYDCKNLQYNKYDNGSYLGNVDNNYLVLVKEKSNSITSCEINLETKFIQSYAFYNNDELENIEIPTNVTSIGDNAFVSCSKLKTVTFGQNSKLENIGSATFDGCLSLESIEIPARATLPSLHPQNNHCYL